MGIDVNKAYIIMSRNSGKVLDVPRGSDDNGAEIIQYQLGNSDNQKWQFKKLDGKYAGYYGIISVSSKKCLDVKEGSLKNDAKIIQFDWGEGDNQVWEIHPVSTDPDCDTYTFRNFRSQKMLDVPRGSIDNEVKIVQYDSGNGLNQKWIITPAL